MEPEERVGWIEKKLLEGLDAQRVEVIDEGHLHAGHAGAKSGRGHFRALIVADRFDGLSRVARQRLVFDVLAVEMESEIHALAMRTLTPAEAIQGQGNAG